ncbi:MAG: hypothetical protein F4205_02160, partial [Gemmatimonadetes bacterium]|nr:hypothetical protein [Gemmatimonadota bacterium]
MNPIAEGLCTEREPPVHDAIYKELYSLPEAVEGLVRALAPRRARLVDFASLSRLPADYVTSEQAPRCANGR